METTHDRLQQDIFLYVWNTYPQSRYCMWHTPNEVKRDIFWKDKIHEYFKGKVPYFFLNALNEYGELFIRALAKRKAIGVLKGVVDLTMYYKNVMYCFDIKIGDDKLSPEQNRFIETVRANGGQFYEINSLEQGKRLIDIIFENADGIRREGY